MKLIFVRHGHPDYVTDTLTEKGHPQAEAAAHRLEREHITKIYSSSCGRAVQTAEHTAKLLGLPVTQLEFMREIRWGVPGGDNAVYNPWNAALRMAGEGIDLFHHDPKDDTIWKGTYLEESVKKVREGFDALLAELGYQREGGCYRCVKQNEDVIAIFSHGGSSSAAMSHLLGVEMLGFAAVYCIDYTSISIFEFRMGEGEIGLPSLVLFNDHAHLESVLPNAFF